ncbi:transcriptional regulator KdgR [Clostridium pasteurianum DSM 525 = ATCC 6013]|uniref:Glycerol operon regulatory protein n=1 Tax=Clostridium pasteurianum DSM 525 = ATCC 6013 TaxID=1262449 RepID=A0A0H3J953_CLOPA|nr:IclR family transcriptional regulator [Clostridium pasteurianum]AJA50044.1 transcriptional regulator KdgR [Clostridium pasteurianum DSM 525 = ATCC 6013]AJA54032.1 transcriptional regulator KdgR [Clostridium pasteurianum DSM 525 = ATCC 6013]AOZ77170.1 IclR family transcriptional regulator [Clostridium pasteurianum DSM 525 = ATCC 6013]AOZ80967.1 IclR family transcriptional regulator [Clostridium pasteurianum]ELP59251.1 IclR family transcriptional regulator [Clostridium pasteurianum DSM 525 = 
MQEVVQSVDRTLSILELLSDYENGLGITEISEKVNLHKSTVHRLLNTLMVKGYVQQSEDSNRYKLTLKLFELGSKKVEKMNIVNVARPLLKELMEKTNEVIHLVVREGIDIVYVAKVESQNPIRMYSRIGKKSPMYCTAVGKSMMSHMSEEEVNLIWKNSNVEKLTEYTITDFQTFKDNIDLIRNEGYAIDEQENEIGIRCIAASVLDYSGNIVGAISISGSIISFKEEKIQEFSKLIIEYSNRISQELGYKCS